MNDSFGLPNNYKVDKKASENHTVKKQDKM